MQPPLRLPLAAVALWVYWPFLVNGLSSKPVRAGKGPGRP